MIETAPSTRGGTAAQLRADIDAGRTGDKVAFPDPALTPLGTDDEAGGAPPPTEVLEADRIRENAIGAIARSGTPSATSERSWFLPSLLTLLLLLVIAIATYGLVH